MPPQKRWHVRTSSFLSSQVVSNQVLSTYECLTTVFGMGTGGSTQLSPLDFFLRSTRVSVPSKLYRRQMEHFSWQNLAVNVSQSPARFALGSWDVFAYDLLPNRLSPLGQVSRSSPRHISTGRLHALRRFHSPPINLIVFEVPYRTAP